MPLLSALDAWFSLGAKRSTVTAEIRGGFVAFVSTAYLLLLIPNLLASALPPIEANSTPQASLSLLSNIDTAGAVSLSIILATLTNGLVTNTPVVIVPGLGLSAFFAVITATHSLSHALSCAFLSSLLLTLTSLVNLNSVFSRVIPNNIKIGSMVGLGLFVSLTGMLMARIVVVSPYGLTLGALISNPATVIVSFTGFIVIAALMYHRVSAGMLIGIVITTGMYYLLTWTTPVIGPWQWPALLPSQSEFLVAGLRTLGLASLPTVLSFYFLQLFDLTTMIHTVTGPSYLSYSQANALALERKIYCLSGTFSMIAALYACPPLIIAVETVMAIKSGGKTGLASLVTCVCYLLSLPVVSALSLVPPLATAACSIVVGSFLVAECGRIPWNHPVSALPAFITIVLVPFTGSVANGIIAGLVTHVCLCLSTGHPIMAWRHEESAGDGDYVSDGEFSEENEDEESRLTHCTSPHGHPQDSSSTTTAATVAGTSHARYGSVSTSDLSDEIGSKEGSQPL